MATFEIQEAEARLLELIARAESGEDIVIVRSGVPVARLTPLAAAESALVAGVYEAVFYRGLPSNAVESQWAYDYGCLLAYDVSESAYLEQAWKSVVSKRLFWEDASVFVMILRGAGLSA